MRILFFAVILLLITSQAQAFNIIINVPDNKIERIKTAFLISYPNLECLEYVDFISMECKTKKYTDNQWIKECLRRFLKTAFLEGEQITAKDAALKAMPSDHDSLVTAQ